MSEEIKFDHFKDINDLLKNIDSWYREDDIEYTRWFGLTDLYKLKIYITSLQEKVEQLEKENEATLKNYGNLVKEWKQLENIRKEAIEYIENNQTPISEPTTTLMKLYGRCLFERHCDDLLNILNKGSE